jgi:hypothetical protein
MRVLGFPPFAGKKANGWGTAYLSGGEVKKQ